MKRIVVPIAFLGLMVLVTSAFSAPPGKGKDGGRDGGGRRPGAAGGAGRMDPSQMATKMMQKHDQNGDGSLNVRELTALLTQMRQMRGNGGPGGKAQGAGGRGAAAGGRRGPGAGDGGARGGPGDGKRLKRPKAAE
jgi:hypothetical protein